MRYVCQLGCIGLLWGATIPTFAAVYDYYDLGPLPSLPAGNNQPEQIFGPQSINNNGVIVGVHKDLSGVNRLLVWDLNIARTITSPSQNGLNIHAIDDAENVVGSVLYDSGGSAGMVRGAIHIVLGTPPTITNLPFGQSGYTSDAFDVTVNGNGEVVIGGYINSNVGKEMATVWVNGTPRPAGDLNPAVPSRAMAINAGGQVTGYLGYNNGLSPAQQSANNYSFGFLLDYSIPTVVTAFGNCARPLGAGVVCGEVPAQSMDVVDGQGNTKTVYIENIASGINSLGQVVGGASSTLFPRINNFAAWLTNVAFVWDPQLTPATFTELPRLLGIRAGQQGIEVGTAWAAAINDSADIVGSASRSDQFQTPSAVIWRINPLTGEYNIFDLTTEIDTNLFPDVVLDDARDINNAGQIVGIARVGSIDAWEYHGFLLVQVGTPVFSVATNIPTGQGNEPAPAVKKSSGKPSGGGSMALLEWCAVLMLLMGRGRRATVTTKFKKIR